MTDFRFGALLQRVAEAIERVQHWEVIRDPPEGYDVYRGSYRDINVYVGGHQTQDAILEGTAVFLGANLPILRLTPEMAHRALELARSARRAQAS